ncbi:MAG TPA: carboxypeptidase regulatory-like domain-containing protein [Xanthomonadaceae bacterium]|nr:carboxypeptidase regulatory-like domain-containing protein [Xanthomonadaceae bacterium]
MRTPARWSCPSLSGPSLVWLFLLAAALPAPAAQLSVRVGDGRHLVADAVVNVFPADGTAHAAATPVPATATIDQRDLMFVPHVQVARPGGSAVFRNSDHTRHHVYSFAPAATFEMVLGPRERSRPVPLLEAGVVAIGCNIHDQMIAWLYVSDAPWLARTGGDGAVAFDALPPGDYRVVVWHPRLEARDRGIERRVTLDGSDAVTLDIPLRLRPDVRAQPDPERADY